MKKYISVLKESRMFLGVPFENIESLAVCLGAKMKSYRKGECIFGEGDVINELPVLVDGHLHIRREDYWGNRSILGVVSPGEMFGEVYAFLENGVLLYDVVALEDSIVIFFDVKKVLSVCSNACRFHSLVISNMFSELAYKNKKLVLKLKYMSRRTTREKLLSYLSDESKRQNSPEFCIPFNRQQLADFLSVDRSAMSNELCKMRDEGILEFRKNRFRLL